MLTSQQIEPLLSPRLYPAEVAADVVAISPLAVTIANRWAMGWPKHVKAMLAEGTYLEALRQQEEVERRVLSEAQNMRHLARHEVMEEFGLSPAPPM
jgi:hypothetical protein